MKLFIVIGILLLSLFAFCEEDLVGSWHITQQSCKNQDEESTALPVQFERTFFVFYDSNTTIIHKNSWEPDKGNAFVIHDEQGMCSIKYAGYYNLEPGVIEMALIDQIQHALCPSRFFADEMVMYIPYMLEEEKLHLYISDKNNPECDIIHLTAIKQYF